VKLNLISSNGVPAGIDPAAPIIYIDMKRYKAERVLVIEYKALQKKF